MSRVVTICLSNLLFTGVELETESRLDASIDIAFGNSLGIGSSEVDIDRDLGAAVNEAVVAIVKVSAKSKAGFAGEGGKDRTGGKNCNQENRKCSFVLFDSFLFWKLLSSCDSPSVSTNV